MNRKEIVIVCFDVLFQNLYKNATKVSPNLVNLKHMPCFVKH
jgi:hypothetical protein